MQIKIDDKVKVWENMENVSFANLLLPHLKEYLSPQAKTDKLMIQIFSNKKNVILLEFNVSG